MRIRLESLSLLKKSSGFSLTELVVVLAILGIVAAGTSAQLLSNHRSIASLQSKATMTQTMTLVQKSFGKNRDGARACKDILLPVGQFDPNGETQVRINMGSGENDLLQEGMKVNGAARFEIGKLYLADNFPLVQRPNSYVSTLYMQANAGSMDNLRKMRPRSVATVVVTLDPATGGIKECNVSTQMPNNRETCDAMYGMSWDENAQECQQALALDTDFNLTACPAGTRKVGQSCIPTATGCGNGQLARGFDLGQVQTCATPPLNPAVGIPTLPVAPPVEGQANATPAPDPNAGNRLPAVTSGAVDPTSPSATPTQSCADLIGSVNYSYCMANPTCRTFLESNPPADATCVSRTSVAYSTPHPQTTPSYAPPPDLSCACNSARIQNGDYCMYCIPQVDYGYGYVDYAYGVSKCTDGSLVPDPSAPVSFPPPECSGGYAPVRRIIDRDGASRFRQQDGYGFTNLQ